MANRTVRVAFLGDVSSLKAALDQSERALAKQRSSIQQTADTLDKAGNRFIAAGAVMAGALGFMARAADDAQQSQIKLDNTLANAPQLAGANKQALLDLATAQQTKTKYDDEAYMVAESLLGQYGATQSQIESLIPLVADYASKTGTDLADAAKAVGKALDGKTKALVANGVEIDANLYKTDRYRAVQLGLNQAVGGFAEQEGKTFSGQLAIIKNQLSDVAEGVGVGVLDAFSKVLAPVKALSSAFTSLPAPIQSFIGGLGAVSAGSLLVVGGVLKAVGALMKMGEQMGVIGARAGQFMKIDFTGRWDDSATKTTKSMLSLNSVMSAGVALAAAAATAWALWTAKQQEFTQAGRDTSKLLDDQIAKQALTWQKLDNGIAAASSTFKDMKREAGDVSWYEVWNLDAKAATDSNAESAQNMLTKMVGLRTQAEYLSASLGISREKALMMAQANMAAGRAATDMAGETEAENNILEEQSKAFDQAVQSAKGYFDFFRGQVDALGSARQANRDFVAALQQNGLALDINTDKGWKNIQSVEGAISKWEEWGIQQIKAGADVDATTTAVNGQVASLRAQYVQMGGNQAQFDFWVASLHATPADIRTAFSTPGLAEANAAIGELIGKLSQLGNTSAALRGKAAQLAAFGQTEMAAQLNRVADTLDRTGAYGYANVPGRAVGGSVLAGGSYLVGERGPEVLRMGSRSGKVETMAQAAPFGGGGEERIVLEVDGRVLAEVLRRREVANL